MKENKNNTIQAFFTRNRANDGVDLEINLPDETPSGMFVKVRHVDSDAFRVATAERQRELTRIMALPEAERPEAYERANATLVAALVVSWTFETPFTKESVIEFLLEAKGAYEQINEFTGDRARFFATR